jgi:hypothetical protein
MILTSHHLFHVSTRAHLPVGMFSRCGRAPGVSHVVPWLALSFFSSSICLTSFVAGNQDLGWVFLCFPVSISRVHTWLGFLFLSLSPCVFVLSLVGFSSPFPSPVSACVYLSMCLCTTHVTPPCFDLSLLVLFVVRVWVLFHSFPFISLGFSLVFCPFIPSPCLLCRHSAVSFSTLVLTTPPLHSDVVSGEG